MGGVVVAYEDSEKFAAEMKEILLNLGGYMSPHSAYMQTLGLENLESRYNL